MTMWTWAHEHPVLFFILAFAGIGLTATVSGRVFRTVNVLARGWPPGEHLDAEGTLHV